MSNNIAASQFSIRTSDRRTFRRCLRKWDFQSSLRQNLTRAGAEQNINFWFGSAIHFAMEDFHGYNRFQDPRRALYAYYHAFAEDDKPVGAETHYSLGISMLTYYMTWMERHNQQTGFETLWVRKGTYEPADKNDPDAVPAVEIEFYLPLDVYVLVDVSTEKIIEAFYYREGESNKSGFFETPSESRILDRNWSPQNSSDVVYRNVDGLAYRVIPIFYHGTIDRIVKDRYGRYWLWDYKTAKSADTAKLATDDQVSAYLWAAAKLFPFPVYGFVYLQMTKERVQEPRRLKDGSLSIDKRQRTTYALLRQELLREFEDINTAPSKYIQFLNHLASLEEPEGDRFIRWDFVKRSAAQLASTERNIYGELSTMTSPHLYCYPSPTRDCSWDCPFRDACIMMDDNDISELSNFMEAFEKRPHSEDGNQDAWRQAIAWPRIEQDGTTTGLPPMDEILEYDSALVPQFGDDAEPEDTFKFHYEEDC